MRITQITRKLTRPLDYYCEGTSGWSVVFSYSDRKLFKVRTERQTLLRTNNSFAQMFDFGRIEYVSATQHES